jgi:hypothetical protein
MTPSTTERSRAFEIKDCALITLATGRRALTLQELRNELTDIPGDSVFCHFWGALLQARFEEREFNNDFAAWARHELHDHVVAERLAMLDPSELSEIDELRSAVLEVLDDRIDEEPYLARRLATREFHFLSAQVVIFDTGLKLGRAEELTDVVPALSAGSIFFHFVEARRRHDQGLDDFSAWLQGFNGAHAELIDTLRHIDPYFGSLVELRRKIDQALALFFAERKG